MVNKQIPYHKPHTLEIDYKDILESGMLTNGYYCKKLEERIEAYYHMPALVCSSGTMALLLAFEGVKNRFKEAMPREWELPAFTWYSDLWVINKMGLIPKFRDIHPEYWYMENWESSYAQLPTLTFGCVDDFWGDFMIYDATHCFGTKYLPRDGLAIVFSLAATKLVTGCEGGILLATDPVIFNHAAYLRDKVGRMSELHAKTALSYFDMLPDFLKWKKRVFEYYKKNIEGECKWQLKGKDHTYNTIGFVSEEIQIPPHIIYKQYYEPLVKLNFINTEYIYNNIKCLPSWYGVDYKKIVEDINEYNSGCRKQLERQATCFRANSEAFRDWYKPD